MPYVREWEDPEVVIRHGGVVVHYYFLFDDDESPCANVYAVYEPESTDADGDLVFGSLERREPKFLVNVEEVAHLVDISPTRYNHMEILRRLIDAGHLTQKEFSWDTATPWEEPDTLTIPLPFEEVEN